VLAVRPYRALGAEDPHMIAAAFLLGIGCGWSAALHTIRKRQAKADELRFLIALTIPHSVEDAARRMGC